MQRRGMILVIWWGFVPLFAFTQNLVPNPGFEDPVSCINPPSNESMQNCADWFNAVEPLSTVDWFSTCYPSGSFYLLPDLYFGYSYPRSGEAMIGFAPYSLNTHLGECFGVRLNEPLKADSAYCVGFWMKNSQNKDLDYTMYEFNVSFTTDTAGINGPSDLPEHILLENYSETDGWNYLSTYYIAHGGEEFMLTGVFDPSPNFYIGPHEPGFGKYMYYYVDDISVTPCNKDSLLAVVLELPNVFTPNGDTINAVYRIQHHNLSSLNMQVFNRWGNLVREYDGLVENWDGRDQNGTDVPEGVYFIKAVAESRFGETFSKQQFIQLFK